MGKKQKKTSEKHKNKIKSKNIQKSRGSNGAESPGISEKDVGTLFELLFLNDQKNLERALMTLSAISFNDQTPMIHKFYEEKVIQRLLKVAEHLESKTSYMALDALR